jgi:signal transduction histidine kinase
MIAASALLALIVGGAFALLLLAIGDLRGTEQRNRHAQDVLLATNQLERLLLDLETGQRGFVLTGQVRFLEPWNAARVAFPGRAARLRALVAGEPSAELEATEIAQRERAYIRLYSVPLVNAARRDDPSARSVAAADAGKKRVDAMRREFDGLIAAARRIDASSRARADSAARRASAAAVVGIVGSIALIALYAAYLSRSIVRPVRRVAQMAGRLAGGDLSVRMTATGAGEIGVLERAFNVMGGSLESSRAGLAALAAEQAALRRVATLVARAAPPEEVFAAVADEVGQLLPVSSAAMGRYEPDGLFTTVAAWSAGEAAFPIGKQWIPEGKNVMTIVFETGRPARMDTFADASGPVGLAAREAGYKSAVGTPIIVDGRLWGVMTAASSAEEPLPSDIEARLASFTELVATAVANAHAHAELTASRARIAATADETRRRIERDLHDGAQQRLVSLTLQLRAAQTDVPAELEELSAELDHVAVGLTNAQEELREFARGIHPAILSEGGLRPALKTLARRSPIPVRVDVLTDGRLPEPIEVAAYYVVSEAFANAAKHANASNLSVEVEVNEDVLRLTIRDDGVGGADFARGSGLVGLKDRVEALGGRIKLRSEPGSGTLLFVELPLDSEADAVVALT